MSKREKFFMGFLTLVMVGAMFFSFPKRVETAYTVNGCCLSGAVAGGVSTAIPLGASLTIDSSGPNPTLRAIGTEAAVAFAALPACPPGTGGYQTVNNSNTNTWGATIAGGGTNFVLAFCDGTNWTVAGK